MVLLSKKNGTTLIELVASITILAMIVGVTVSISIFGDKNFEDGVNRSSAHRNANIVSEYLSEEIRNASDFIVLSTGNVFTASGYKGFKLESTTFKGFIPETSNVMPNVDMISDVRFYVYSASGSSMMHVQIVMNLGTDGYVLDREILLNNLRPEYIGTKIVFNTWYSLTVNNLYYKV